MEGDTSSNKKENKNSKESQDRPADILATKMLRELKKNYALIAKGRIISWKLWLAVGIMVGATAGVVYVANRSGEFEAGKAQYAASETTSDLIIDVRTTLSNDSGAPISQVGTVTLNHEWKKVSLDHTFINPIVIAKSLSMKGSHSAHVRIRRVKPDSFQMKVEEWKYLDGSHRYENVSYIVMEAGIHTIDNKTIEAGNTSTTHAFSSANFTADFFATPIVMTQSQTRNGGDPIVTRNRNITKAGFEVKLQEEEANGRHAKEIIGYIAAEEGVYNLGAAAFQALRSENIITNEWNTIRFNPITVNYISLLTDMQTTNGNDPANLRYKGLKDAKVKIRVQEEKSKDSEMTHKAETVGYFVFEIPTAPTDILAKDTEILQRIEPTAEESEILLALKEEPEVLAPATEAEYAVPTCPTISPEETIELPDPVSIQNTLDLLTDANSGLIQATGAYTSASGAAKAKLANHTERFASARKLFLAELMRKDPDTAFQSIILETLRQESNMTAVPQDCKETSATVEGELEILHADFFDDGVSAEQYTIATDQRERIQIHPADTDELRDSFISGMRIQAKGYRLDNNFLFDAGSSGDFVVLPQYTSSSPSLNFFANALNFVAGLFGKELYAQYTDAYAQLRQEAQGEQKTVVLMVNFQDTSKPAVSRDTIHNRVFTDMGNYYRENSYGKTWISGNTFPLPEAPSSWYTIPINQTCDFGSVLNELIATADPDINFTQYDRLIIAMPKLGCRFGGIASMGKHDIQTEDGIVSMSTSWVISTGLSIFAHEFGHSLGLNHAGYLWCKDVTIAPSSCRTYEYGDDYDVMGGQFGHLNAPHKEYLGWFNDSNIRTLSRDEADIFIEPIELASAEELKAIKIPRGLNAYGVDDFLYVEYRQPIGFDRSLEHSAVYQGGLLHSAWGRSGTLLLDAAPSLPGPLSFGSADPTLRIGNSFTDYANGVTITVTEKTEEALTVDVDFDTLDLIGESISFSPVNPSLGEAVSFSGTMKNQGIGNLEINAKTNLRIDTNNDGSWDIGPVTKFAAPLMSDATETITWSGDNWTWLSNGNSTIEGVDSWTAIGRIAEDTTRLAFGLWADLIREHTISGNQENYQMSFNDGTCTRSYEPGGRFLRGGCLVFSDLSSDILYDEHADYPDEFGADLFSQQALDGCHFRYTASTRLVEFRDTDNLTDCGFAVFGYGPIWIASAGTHKAEVCADVANYVAEADETNNCKAQVFTVPSSDLTIDSISFPSTPLSGDSMSFTAVVENMGAGSLNEVVTSHLRIDIGSDGIWDVGPIVKSIEFIFLPGGIGKFFSWPNAWTAIRSGTVEEGGITVPGTHKAEICVDAPNDVIESDETNNCISKEFTAGACEFLYKGIQEGLRKSCGDPLYTPSADIDNNGSINVLDLTLLLDHWKDDEPWCATELVDVSPFCE